MLLTQCVCVCFTSFWQHIVIISLSELRFNFRNRAVKVKVKVNVTLQQATKSPEGEQMYSSTLPSNSALDGASTSRPGRFTPGKDLVNIVQEGGWASGAGLDGSGKSRPPPGFDPRTVQPVASRYTD